MAFALVAASDAEIAIAAIGLLMFVALLYIFGVAIIGSGRNYRRSFFDDRKREPTSTEDVWAMHRLPEEDDRQGESDDDASSDSDGDADVDPD